MTTAVSPQRCFLEGLLSNVLNPKVAVFYLAFLPQFIGPTDAVLPRSLLLAGIHYVEGMLWLVMVSMVVEHTRGGSSCSPPCGAGWTACVGRCSSALACA